MMASSEFKREHPVRYWLRLLLIACCGLAVGYLMSSGAYGGLTKETWGTLETATYIEYPSEARFERNIYGDMVRTYFDDDYDILFSVSEDGTGGPWVEYELISNTVESWTYASPSAIFSTSTGTFGIIYSSFEGNNTHDTYLAYHDQGDSWESWTIVEIHESASYAWVPSVAINETDHVLLVAIHNTHTTYRIWDHQALTISEVKGHSPQTWEYTEDSHWATPRTHPLTNDWWLAHTYWSGSAWMVEMADFNRTDVRLYTIWATGSYSPSNLAWSFISDGSMVFVMNFEYNALDITYIRYYQTEPDLTINAGLTLFMDVGNNVWRKYDGPSICVNQNDYVTVSVFNSNVSAPADNGRWIWMAPHDASVATWQSTMWHMDTQGDGLDYGWGESFGKWWPKHEGGEPTNVPKTGWIAQIGWMDAPVPTWRYFRTAFNCTFTSAEVWDESSGGGGGTTDWAGDDGGPWHISTEYMGDLWTLFIVTATVVGIMTAYRKYSDQYRGWMYARKRWSQYRKPIYGGYRKRTKQRNKKSRKYNY